MTPHAPPLGPVRIVHVEDSAEDAELLAMQVADAGIEAEFVRVETEDALRAELDRGADIVLSDVSLPAFSGYAALDVLRARDRVLPFVFVSGTIDEAMAVEALQRGANDYVLKDNPVRLPSAVVRAIREARTERERARAEKELMRSQRLDCLAILAAGLSHDLRNVLQPLLIVPGLMENYSDDPRLRRLSALVSESGRRGHEMAESMLSFVRGSRMAKEAVDVAALFRAVRLLLQGSLPRQVQLDIREPAPGVAIEGNQTELQQVLINLALNGVQAMEGRGGTLTLSAEDVHDGGQNCVRLRVVDEGVGMDADTLAKLFTPFFTTKRDGTGLGLLSCKRIVESLGGRVSVESVVGRGTAFDLVLPAAAAEEPAWMPDESYREGQGQRIVVIDDDVTRASLLVNALASQGYDPTAVRDVVAALRHLAAVPAPALLVVDAALLAASAETLSGALDHTGFAGRMLVMEADNAIPGGDAMASAHWFASLCRPLQMGTVFRTVEAALSQPD